MGTPRPQAPGGRCDGLCPAVTPRRRGLRGTPAPGPPRRDPVSAAGRGRRSERRIPRGGGGAGAPAACGNTPPGSLCSQGTVLSACEIRRLLSPSTGSKRNLRCVIAHRRIVVQNPPGMHHQMAFISISSLGCFLIPSGLTLIYECSSSTQVAFVI